MTTWCKISVLLVFAAIVGVGMPAAAGDAPATVEIAGGAATVSLLDGSAWVQKGARPPESALSVDSRVFPGDRVRIGKGSRLELELPDGSFLRFDESTSFTVLASGYREKDQSRDIRIRMLLGKAWARVSRFLLGRGRFVIETPTAVAGVRGTVYRLNLNQDRSATVKVYDGEVEVRRRQEDQAAEGPGVLKAPHPVSGPQPVTMEQWVYIVGALQQIDIRSDGTAAPPFRFDIEADLNDWVRWNQMRDEKIREVREKLQK
ncbi:MAG: FecR domain-containing protein [Desulfobacterales bacterium]|jgi:ferric-dicitrate binding protein FerR (iron transport regulator)